MSGDQEFEDFLERRRSPFRREADDGLEPPPELDRIVLRQAREAIESERPMRLFRMPRWAAPVAIAATLVLGLAVVFRAGMPPTERVPEVRVENAAQRIDFPPPAPPPATSVPTATDPESGTVVVTLGTPMGATAPSWRSDAKAWQAEIERLRASGEQARAAAEQAEFNRQYRAYAVSPDR
jgi:hypothetical protein